MVDDPKRRAVLKLTALGVTATMGGPGLVSAQDTGGFHREGTEPGSLELDTDRFGIELDNGRFDVEIGEDRTFDLFFEGEETLFFKYFSLQTGDEPLVPSFEGTILDRFPDTGVPGEGYTSVLALSVAGTTLNVERTVTLDPEEARFSLDYTVRNVGAEPVPDLKLLEWCDYDIGFSFENAAVYESGEDDLVYVKDVSFEDTNIHAGFSGEEPSEEHHVAAERTEGSFRNGFMNNEDRFPDSGGETVAVALQWGLGDLPPGESTSFTVQFGAARSLATLRELVADRGDLEELIEDKRALVEDIRNGARPLVTAGKAATIDEAADSLLEAVEDREFGDDEETIDQYEEALERVLGAEQVTETATRRPKSISEDIAMAVVNATYVGGVEAATLGLGELGVSRRVINWLLDFVGDTAREFDDVVSTFQGADEVAEVVTTFERRVEDLFESNPGAVEAAAENVIDGFADDDPESFEGAIEELVPEDAFETLVEPVFDAVEESNELLAEAVYQQYYFEATLNNDRFALPSLDELEEAVNAFETDFPPFVPDFDPQAEDLDLPGGEPVDDAIAYLNSFPVQLGLVTGIDPVVEREIRELEDGVAAGDLAEVDDDVRETLVQGLDLAVDVLSDASEALIDFLRVLVDLVADLEFVVALGIVVAGASAIASGGAALELVSVLGAAAFNLAVVGATLSFGGALVGTEYLVGVGKLHEAATVGLLDDVGDVSAFGAGGG